MGSEWEVQGEALEAAVSLPSHHLLPGNYGGGKIDRV